jgi:hypothetical protein
VIRSKVLFGFVSGHDVSRAAKPRPEYSWAFGPPEKQESWLNLDGNATLPPLYAIEARRAGPPNVSPARKGWDADTKHARAPEVRHRRYTLEPLESLQERKGQHPTCSRSHRRRGHMAA